MIVLYLYVEIIYDPIFQNFPQKEIKYYKNGQKSSEKTYKDRELISLKEWKEDGSVKE